LPKSIETAAARLSGTRCRPIRQSGTGKILFAREFGADQSCPRPFDFSHCGLAASAFRQPGRFAYSFETSAAAKG